MTASPRLPSQKDEAAYVAAVLARVGAEIRRGVRAFRRARVSRETVRDLIARLEAAGRAELEPLPGTDSYSELRRKSPSADRAGPAPAQSSGPAHPSAIPEVSPEFLSNVKQTPQRPFGRRTDCAAALGVSVDWFDRNVDRLMREEAFPRNREGEGQRRWNLALVTAWGSDPANDGTLKRARAAHAKSNAGGRRNDRCDS